MIVVKVELWPGGFEHLAESIATAVIYNDGTGTRTKGNYQYVVGRKGEAHPRALLEGQQVLRRGRITGFARRSRRAWSLVRLVLDDAGE